MLFDVQTTYSSTRERGRERQRESEYVRVYDQRHKHTRLLTTPKVTVDLNSTNNQIPNDNCLN